MLSATYLYKLLPRSAILNRERLAGRLDRPAPVDTVSGCFLLVRAEAIKRAGPFDEQYLMYAEETDFCFRVWHAGLEVHYAPIAEIVHFGGASAKLAARRNFLEHRRSVIRFFVLHRGRAVAECARILLLLFLVLRLPYWSLQALVGRDRIPARAQLGNDLAGAAYLLGPLSPSRDDSRMNPPSEARGTEAPEASVHSRARSRYVASTPGRSGECPA